MISLRHQVIEEPLREPLSTNIMLFQAISVILFPVSKMINYQIINQLSQQFLQIPFKTSLVLWEHQVAGSNPVAPTQSKPSHTCEFPRLAFLLRNLSTHKADRQRTNLTNSRSNLYPTFFQIKYLYFVIHLKVIILNK